MIYYFNPSCEMAVRQDQPSYTPPKNVAQMEDDLSSIMMFLGSDGDCVVCKQPDDKLIDFWRPMIGQRNFITDKEATSRILSGEKFTPWGLSRATIAKYGLPNALFKQGYRLLLSRRTSTIVEHLVEQLSQGKYASASTLVDKEDKLKSLIDELRENSNYIVIKSLWSASGRGVRFFNLDTETRNAIDYAERCIKADNGVVIENKLDRVAEFSYIFFYSEGQIKYDGINIYHSLDGGGMGWEIAGRQPFLPNLDKHEEGISSGAEYLKKALSDVLSTTGYEGPIGVDAMLYKNGDGQIMLRPCTEVNIRYCMGHIARNVAKLFAKDTPIKWQMSHFSEPNKWKDFCEEQERLYPTLFNSAGEITSGFFRLTPIGDTTQFGAYGWSGECGILKM